MGHRGRPRKAQARSRATTRKGRMAPPDKGTKELRRHRLVLSGSVLAEADTLGVLHARGCISEDGYTAGRNYQALTVIARRGWGLQEGSVAELWRRVISGTVDLLTGSRQSADLIGTADANTERARLALGERRKALEAAGLHVLFVVNSIVLDNHWSPWLKRIVNGSPARRGDFVFLGDLRTGLAVLDDLRRRSRRRKPPQAEAAE